MTEDDYEEPMDDANIDDEEADDGDPVVETAVALAQGFSASGRPGANMEITLQAYEGGPVEVWSVQARLERLVDANGHRVAPEQLN